MEQKMGKKLTKNERNWILYDVGNSAFTLLIATILPIYFNYLAGNAGISSVDYLAYWGYAASVGTILVALAGPVLGTMADTKGFKKPIFTAAILTGVAGCALLGLAKGWLLFLVIYIIAKVGFSSSLIFYDSMLGDVTDEDRVDYVSSAGYAWGYIGSCVPFIVCLVLVLGSGKIGISMEMSMMIAFLIIAAWWLVMSLPLLKGYEQKFYVEKQKHAVKESFCRLGQTFGNIRKEKHIFMFLLAFFFYIDGVYTIIDMATAYGAALGLDSTGLLLALLVTQLVAFRKIIRQNGNLPPDYRVYLCLSWNCNLCRIFKEPGSVLDTCGTGWNVSGWNSGVVPFIFYKNHSCRKVRRIFRTDGHLRKRRIIYGNNDCKPCIADNRKHQRRCRHDCGFICSRHYFVP